MTSYIDTSSNFFETLFEQFTTKTENIELSPENIAKVLSVAMTVVEASELKGEEQKLVAKELLRKSVLKLTDEGKKKILNSMLDNNVIEDIIETIILATKGELQINKLTNQLKRRCCSFF